MQSSERWTTHVADSVFVVEFPHGTGLTPDDGEALLDEWQRQIPAPSINAVVLIVRTTRPCSDVGRQTLRTAARSAVAHGIRRFALVGERSKRQYLERTVDIDGVTAELFNDAATAVEWAGCREEPCPPLGVS